MIDPSTTSTRPYLIRAIHEWCTDNGLTPYLAVKVDRSVQVPREFVHDGEIVLNVSYDATGSLQMGNEFIEFKARFGGKPRDIMVPVERVQAIYARESGQGMSFPVTEDLLADVPDAVPSPGSEATPEDTATSAEAAGTARVVQLVPSSAGEATDGDSSTPVPPPPPTSGRPALKRIK
jgi:stringent starvation protein B